MLLCLLLHTALVFAKHTQAYLSPTRYDHFSASSTTWVSDCSTRAPCALHDSGTVNVVQKQHQPHEHAARNVGFRRFWHEIDNRSEGSGGEEGGREYVEGTFLSSRERGAVSLIENVESPNKIDMHVLPRRPSRPIPGDSDIAFGPRAAQAKGQDNLEGPIVNRNEIQMPSRGNEGSSKSRPRPSSLGSHPEQDSLNWYPSRPASAEASVSLISPRTSKKIRRLPTPGQIEEEALQVLTLRLRARVLVINLSINP